MADHPEADRRVESVGYFLLRVHRVRAVESTSVDGQIERLGAGEKVKFASAAELLTLIEHWHTGPTSAGTTPLKP